MRVLAFVFCLVVIYETCGICAEENSNSTSVAPNNATPVKTYLLKHKRSVISSAINTGLDIIKLGTLPADIVVRNIRDVITTVETIICRILNAMSKETREWVLRAFSLGWNILQKLMPIFMSELHQFLNLMKPYLPPSIRGLINLFNMWYALFKLLGYL